jgi:hypothetical protein
MKEVLREIEKSGLQPSEDSMVIVELVQEHQLAAQQSVVAELEDTLPESKAGMLSESAAACHYLEWSSLELQVIERNGGLSFKVAHVNRPDVGGGGSTTETLSHYSIEQLRERWGHLVNFTQLEAILKAEKGIPQP